MNSNTKKSLTDLSRYIYGTTRLGDSNIPFADRVAIARKAIEAGGWIHTSNQYNDALTVLNAAFDVDRSAVPPVIVKIGWSTVEEVRGQIIDQSKQLGISKMAIGQLCAGGQIADDLATGGPSIAGLAKLKEEGLVGRFVLEVFPWTSQIAINAIKGGFANDIVDGFIFYLNPLQRFANNELWDLLIERDLSIVAMRTVSGGDVHVLKSNPHAPEYLRTRAAAVAPLFDRSGIATWAEFSARYSLGFSQVRATVGATSRVNGLAQFLAAVKKTEPLPEDIVGELLALQRTWSDEVDIKAEPWTM
jgi:hypothetical protein